MARQTDSGFSLIEALVAMTVLSVAAATLLSAVEEHTRTTAALSDRAVAQWLAENRLVERGLGLDTVEEVVTARGQSWRVLDEITPTSDPDLVRIDIAVEPLDGAGAVLARLTGFLDRAGGAG